MNFTYMLAIVLRCILNTISKFRGDSVKVEIIFVMLADYNIMWMIINVVTII